jgi:hypothetical protein
MGKQSAAAGEASLTAPASSRATGCPPREVHVWRVDLDRACRDLSAYRALLSVDERARAAAFLLERRRERWCHVALNDETLI